MKPTFLLFLALIAFGALFPNLKDICAATPLNPLSVEEIKAAAHAGLLLQISVPLEVDSQTAPSWQAKLGWGRALRSLGDFSLATKYFRESLNLAPEADKDRLRFELLKVAYLSDTAEGFNEALRVFHELPEGFSQKTLALNAEIAAETHYLAALCALRLGKAGTAREFLAPLPQSNDFAFFGNYALILSAQKEKNAAPNASVWQKLLQDFPKTESSEAQELKQRARLHWGRRLLQEKKLSEAQAVFNSIPKESVEYQRALLGSGLAFLKSTQSEDHLKALVYLNRAWREEPFNDSAFRARLLLAAGYEKLGAFEKAIHMLQDAGQALQKRRGVYMDFAKPEILQATIEKALLPKSAAAAQANAAVQVLLDTRAAFERLPDFQRIKALQVLNQRNLADLQNSLRYLQQEDFDPEMLKRFDKPVTIALLSEALLENRAIEPRMLSTLKDIERRLQSFELAKKYSSLLLEERQWENASRLVIEKALTGKMNDLEKLKDREKVLLAFYVDDKGSAKNPIIQDFETQVKDVDRELFLENRLLSQAKSYRSGLNDLKFRLQKAAQNLGIKRTEKQSKSLESLRKAITVRQDELEYLEQVLQYDQETKRWRKHEKMIFEYVRAPGFEAIAQEIAGVKTVLTKIQIQDEQAQLQMLLSLTQMQRLLQNAHGRITARILATILKDMIAKEDLGQRHLENLRQNLHREFSNALLKEIKEREGDIARQKARLEFELAKIMDAKNFSGK